ncbi:MAG: choice-of-anchor D domain-containing protein [Lewinellaceae bacterium]|nr:choice-of-anchor D domain-containing protein [Lewinellaceae bacterium]
MANITRTASTNVELHSAGDVLLSAGGINTESGTLLLDPGASPAAVKPTFADTDATASTLSFASDLEIVINGTTTGDGTGMTYSQLTVVGMVDLDGVDLVFSGLYTPAVGDVFLIVDNAGMDAILNTFVDLAEGATIPDFLGSGLSATITYLGGDGNDVVLTVVQTCPATGSVWYVDAAAAPGGNGASWTCAFQNVQEAINAAGSGHEVWVKAGTYKPTTGSLRTIAYTMKNNVGIYGGFNGTETMRSQRNWVSNVTILSGEIGAAGLADNSYHVIYNAFTSGSPLTNTAILDGFTVTAGNADGSFPNDASGGMFNDFASPMIVNCTFSGNTGSLGGAIYSGIGTLNMTNCTVSGNTGGAGGAMYSGPNSNINLVNCKISGNRAYNGSAISSLGGIHTIINCSFSGNISENPADAAISITNPGTVTNLKNCILWGNCPIEVLAVGGGAINATNSIVQQSMGVYPGVGNLNVDPLFVAQPACTAAPTTAADLHLQTCSPAIDAGTPSGAPATDLEGNTRPINQGYDMGAYEFQTLLAEANIQGNSTDIADGDAMPTSGDHTDFGDVLEGNNLVRTFTIQNTGSEVLNVSSIASDNGLFTIGALTPAGPISGSGGSATFTVTFSPVAVGVQNATITVNNDDCSEAVYDFVVTGNGIVPGAALDFDGANDYVDINSSFTQQVFTVEMWLKPGSTQQEWANIIDNNHTDFQNWTCQQVVGNTNQYSFGVAGGGGSSSLQPNRRHLAPCTC